MVDQNLTVQQPNQLYSVPGLPTYIGSAPGGSGGLVTSVFGRVGAVVATTGDYDSGQVTNVSGVAGPTVTAALNTLNTGKVPTTRTISTTAPLAGGGSLAADLTLSVAQVTNASPGTVPQTNGTVGQALIATALATQWGTDFGANDVTTTGILRFGPGPVAQVLGNMRVGNAFTVYFRNFANTTDLLGFTLGNGTSTDTCAFGSFGAVGAPTSIFTQRNGVGSLLQSGTTAMQWSATGITIVTTGVGLLNFSLAGQIQQNGVPLFGWPNAANRNMTFWGDGTQNYQTGEHVVAWLDRLAEPAAGNAGMFFLYSQNGRPTWVTAAFDKIEWTSSVSGTATAGALAALPALPASYLALIINGTARKIPLYNP